MDLSSPTGELSQLLAWSQWWDHADISQRRLLFDLSVKSWGRIGKGLQAIAALAIVLDIIGAKKLRETGTLLRALISAAWLKQLSFGSVRLFVDTLFRTLPPVVFRVPTLLRALRRLLFTVRQSSSATILRLPPPRTSMRFLTVLRAVTHSKRGERRKARVRKNRFPIGLAAEHFEDRYVYPVAAILVLIACAAFAHDQYSKDFPDGALGFAGGFLGVWFFVILSTFALIFAVRISVALYGLVILAFLVLIDRVVVVPIALVIGHPQSDALLKALSLVVFLVGFYFDLLAS